MGTFNLVLRFSPDGDALRNGISWESDWGMVGFADLMVTDSESKVVCKLFSSKFSLSEFALWLRDSRESILTMEPPFILETDVSIASAMSRSYGEVAAIGDFDRSLDRHEILYEYRVKHCLLAGQRGVNLPEVYFGVFKGVTQVSVQEDSLTQFYDVDLNGFCMQVDRLFRSCLGDRLKDFQLPPWYVGRAYV